MQVSDAGLKDFLLGAGAVPRRTLEELEQAATERQEPLAELLVAGGYLSRDELRRAHAHLLGVPFVVLTHDTIEGDALFLIPEPLARERSMVAYRTKAGEVEVALLDLADLEHIDFLRTEKNLKVLPRLTTAESIKHALLVYQKKLKEQFGVLARGGAHAAEALVRHALLSRASSVHLDFKTAGLLVRYRIKGLLQEAMTLPREAVELMARFKEWAGLSPTLHVPQEGAFKLEHDRGSSVRVRVHSSPAHSGERLVLNLLPTHTGRSGFTLESLGLHGESLEQAYKLLHMPHGLIVVAGGAQSGKTTLHYTLLDLLNAHHRSVITIEDEVELVLPHATQLKVRPEVGLNTAATLRAALKQDPDVVMVSSVRDRDTAELVLSAASRGMLVLVGVEDANTFKEDKNLKGVITT
ncbi:MAG: ATPase, T2SS/T4P/T4SS family, partial [Patescibacteria group bacterium]|nr:ATPase, T2SS/T4P/T4SS family [Patescibacteria group bacterium]